MIDLSDYELDLLRKSLNTEMNPGSILIFAVDRELCQEVGSRVQRIMPVLERYGITCLVVDDDASMIVVPEARRVLMLARK